jgi:hypothetical protein
MPRLGTWFWFGLLCAAAITVGYAYHAGMLDDSCRPIKRNESPMNPIVIGFERLLGLDTHCS